MGNNQQRFPSGERHQGTLDLVLILRIGKGGGLVQNYNRGVLQNRAGDGDPLPLPTGELLARFTRWGIPSMLQPS